MSVKRTRLRILWVRKLNIHPLLASYKLGCYNSIYRGEITQLPIYKSIYGNYDSISN